MTWTIHRARGYHSPLVRALCALAVAACSEIAPGPPSSKAVTWSSLSAGFLTTCGVTTAGAAYCWGLNDRGELGDGTTIQHSVPAAVAGGLTFVSVTTAGDELWSLTGFQDHTCGLTTDGTAYCWGFNSHGQVGDSSFDTRFVPVPVAGGLRFVSLTAGNMHTCGLTSAGIAYCWGDNGVGQLGDGTLMNRTVPTSVAGSLVFASLTAGLYQSCGLTKDGAAYCWGYNVNGQLGDSSTDSATGYARLSPVAVAGGLTFVSLAAGYHHTCGLTAGGSAYCWGLNYSGQLGDGSRDSSSGYRRLAPVAVTGGLTFASVTVGGGTCGLTTTGTAYCWGDNVGDGSSGEKLVPTPVAGGLTFMDLTAGLRHTCGVTADLVAYCWGVNLDGELGDGTTTSRLVPVTVQSP